MDDVHFEQVTTDEQKALAGSLIREYLNWLNAQLRRDYGMAFDVESMVASDLSDTHKFHPPDGRFYLAWHRTRLAGVGCLKKLAPEVAEVQRMYVLPAVRGHGIGRAIIDRLIADARALGYRTLRLESLTFLTAAHRLYHEVGFHDIAPYAENSMRPYQSAQQLEQYYSMTVFMEMPL
jgi:GNAT superfamily N-acetyltransferase